MNKCQVCGSEENVVVCNSVLGAAMSVAYCSRCVHDELVFFDRFSYLSLCFLIELVAL